jgi:hypothetical protein
VLNAIYEEDFLRFSYGFRPQRGPHDALDALVVGISGTKVNYILDADIRSFFNDVSQSWLERDGQLQWDRTGEQDRARSSCRCSRMSTCTTLLTCGPRAGDGARPRAT